MRRQVEVANEAEYFGFEILLEISVGIYCTKRK